MAAIAVEQLFMKTDLFLLLLRKGLDIASIWYHLEKKFAILFHLGISSRPLLNRNFRERWFFVFFLGGTICRNSQEEATQINIKYRTLFLISLVISKCLCWKVLWTCDKKNVHISLFSVNLIALKHVS